MPQAGHDFRALHFLFCGLLFPANMPSDPKWLLRARLWRLILTQHRDGHWSASNDVAVAVLCQNLPDARDGADDTEGDPMHFSADTLAAAMPASLAADAAAAGLGPGVAADFWATLVAVAALERMEFWCGPGAPAPPGGGACSARAPSPDLSARPAAGCPMRRSRRRLSTSRMSGCSSRRALRSLCAALLLRSSDVLAATGRALMQRALGRRRSYGARWAPTGGRTGSGRLLEGPCSCWP